MTNFKRKLDDMMGDTSRQEQRIQAGVREKMMSQQQKPKRSWQVPVVATAFVILAIFLGSSLYTNQQLTAKEGRGEPYDPLVDLLEIHSQRQNETFSAIDYEVFMELPTLTSLTDMQYVDSDLWTLEGQSYQTVIERQPDIFDKVVYKQGDVVRTMTNTGSHLPIYDDEYYEIVAVPGDRLTLQDGELTVNGKKVRTELLARYQELDVTIAGGYDQLLNAREYLLLNHFPKEQSVQPATINAVHKIYGKVAGVAQRGVTETIYFEENLAQSSYDAVHYFDLYLYDLIFGTGNIAQQLTVGDVEFVLPTRTSEYFLEAGYRTVAEVAEGKIAISYRYGLDRTAEHVFYMYKDTDSTIWKWGL